MVGATLLRGMSETHPLHGPGPAAPPAAALDASVALAPSGESLLFWRESFKIVTDGEAAFEDLPWPRFDHGPATSLFDLFDDVSHDDLTAAIDRSRVTSMTRTTVVTTMGMPALLTITSFGELQDQAIAVIDTDAVLQELIEGGHNVRTRIVCDRGGTLIDIEGPVGSFARAEISIGHFAEQLIAADARPALHEAVASVLDGEPYARLNVRGASPGLFFEVIIAGRPDGVVIDLFDESHEQQALPALVRSQIQFNQLSETLPVGVFVVGAGGCMEFFSERLHEMFGPKIMSDFGWIDSVYAEDRHILETALAELPEHRTFSVEVRGERADGALGWFRLAGSDMREDDGTLKAVVGFVEDISERKDLHERVEYQASFDGLTELPNRTTVLERLRTCVEDEDFGQTAVLFIDLDGFKLINDTQGHRVGDVVLVEIAQRFRRAVRPQDIIGRFGGDEFVVVAPDISTTREVQRLAQQIHDVLSTPVLADGRIIMVNASIGIAFSEESSTSEQLIGDADIAMYEAKATGRGQTVIFDAPLRQRALQRFDMTADLRHARRRRQLRLEYQPIIDLETNELVGAEGLVRWDHPAMGRISPSVFVPLAEEIGLIADIGEWVVEQACADIERLRTQGLIDDSFVISVNASAHQFDNVASLATSSLAALDQYGLNPGNIRFELTESVPLLQIPEAATRIRQLTNYGFGLAIDDFGTGYSSLGYLTMLPFDVLKLDLSLIAQIEPGSPAMAVVDSLTRMADEMQFTIVAEGIENDKQQTLLHQAGVHYGQGYHISRPITLSALMDLLETA